MLHKHDNYVTFGETLRKLRKAEYMTQKELSEKTGLPRGRLAEYELAYRLPSAANFQTILSAFEAQDDTITLAECYQRASKKTA